MSTALKFPKFLSPNFSFAEAIQSEWAERWGVKNVPKEQKILDSMYFTASNMELIRSILEDNSILVSSFFRNWETNVGIGGSKTSQHMLGEAVDFICPKFGTPLKIAQKIIASGISFDQLILEHTWVHISFKNPSSKNRNQVLSLLSNKKYAVGLTDKKGKPYASSVSK